MCLCFCPLSHAICFVDIQPKFIVRFIKLQYGVDVEQKRVYNLSAKFRKEERGITDGNTETSAVTKLFKELQEMGCSYKIDFDEGTRLTRIAWIFPNQRVL